MNRTTQEPSLRRVLSIALVMLALLASPSFGWQGPAVAPRASAPLTAAERKATALLKTETIREVTTTLSSKEMEGRGTATPGGERAARYLAERFGKLGLKPLGDAGTYLQAVRFRRAEVTPETFFKAGETALRMGEDFVVAPPYPAERADISGNLVFVGYGVVSSELKRDDLAGLDLKGKIAVVLGGRPKGVDEAAWAKAATPQAIGVNLFVKGATAIVITNIDEGNEPYAVIASYLSHPRVALADKPVTAPPAQLPPVIIASNAGAEKLFNGSGTSFAETKVKAASGETVARELNKPATISLRIKRTEATGSNVVAMIEGSDPKLKEEAVAYTAHYDAFGVDPEGRIYPGAADNALGVGEMMAIAEAFARSKARPRRSLIFLAVTGEEYGLLGAEHWVGHPTWPIERVVADLNFDGIGTEIYGPVKRIVGFGMDYSDLGAVLQDSAVANGAQVAPDPLPEEQAFYRSDHYAFVKRGVPALMLLGGPEGDVAVWIARAKKWLATDSHQPTDIVRADWHWDGARTLAVVGLTIGMRVANADKKPAWLPGSPFSRPPLTPEAAAPSKP